MIPAPGTVVVRVARRDGRIKSVATAPAPAPFGRLVAGRSAEDAARLAPLVFSICAAAQEAAARSALGLAPAPDAADRVAAETLREHVLKLCVVWPSLLGEPADRVAPALAARALTAPEARAALRAAVFGADGAAPQGWADLAAWMAAGPTTPARAMAVIAARWDASWGVAALPLLDAGSPPDWPSPTQGGRAVENSPAMRLSDARLLSEIATARGRGMIWRIAARLFEVERLLDGWRPPFGPGAAPAARGAMLARATVGPKGVSAFERLSPTDFALAPDGALARALSTLPTEPDAPLRAVAAMTVETIDPCAPVRLEVADA